MERNILIASTDNVSKINKIYKGELHDSINMFLGDLKRSPDEFFSKGHEKLNGAIVFIDEGFFRLVKKHFEDPACKKKKFLQTFRIFDGKVYKESRVCLVEMHPSDLFGSLDDFSKYCLYREGGVLWKKH